MPNTGDQIEVLDYLVLPNIVDQIDVLDYLGLISRHEIELDRLVVAHQTQIASLESQLSRSIYVHFTAKQLAYCLNGALLGNEISSRILHLDEKYRPLTLISKTAFQVSQRAVYRPAKKTFLAIRRAICPPAKKAPLVVAMDVKETPTLLMRCAVYKTIPKTWLPSTRNLSAECIIGVPTTSAVIPVRPVFPLCFFI